MVDVVESVDAVGHQAAVDGLDWLRSMTISFGLPVQIAQTLQLTWNGATFRATSSHPGLKDYEYGDGKRPPLAPVRKSMTRLEPRLLELMEQRLESVDYMPEAVF